MAISLGTFASGTWDTTNTLSQRDIMEQFLDPHEWAMPTYKILLANKMQRALGPNEKFQIPIVTKPYSPTIATKNARFPTDDIDNVTLQEWGITRLQNGAGTNEVDMKHYRNPTAIYNHIDMKVDAVHKGTTQAMDYLIFSDWSETVSDQQIDIASEVTDLPVPPEELKLNGVSAISRLPFSLPMAARYPTNGHTFGNIAVDGTDNKYWTPEVTDASSATVNRAASGSAIDMVTSITNPEALGIDDLRTHLSKMQTGKQFNLYAPVGRDLFGQLEDIIMAENIRQTESPVANLGIKSCVTWEAYSVVFYHEPMMDALWPTTIWFFDPACFKLVTDEDFDPTSGTGIWQWERVPGTLMYAMMIYMIFQFICIDRRGVGAMHGYTKD